MNHHGIEIDSMLNGDGLRVVLWVAGCENYCKGCHNPQTHDPNGGELFTIHTLTELLNELSKEHIAGLTLSGGDPLYPPSRLTISTVCEVVKNSYPDKTIWLYTGYKYEDIKDLDIMQYIDVLVDGKFVEELKDVNYEWAGSTNQRIIDVQKSLELNKIVLHM